jgi:hypothetical protein
VRPKLAAFLARTQVNEIMFTAAIHDHAARVRSFELLKGLQEG